MELEENNGNGFFDDNDINEEDRRVNILHRK